MKEISHTVTQTTLKDEKRLGDHMPSTKIDAFFAEFPWVGKFLSQSSVRQVYVSRISPEIIGRDLESVVNREVVRTEADFGGVFNVYEDRRHGEVLYLLDGEGSLVNLDTVTVKEIPAVPAHRKYWICGPMVPAVPARQERLERSDVSGKIDTGHLGTRLHALKEKADAVRFILSYWDQSGAAILYKVPKGITLPVWIKQQIDAEQAALKEQCQAIDFEVAAV